MSTQLSSAVEPHLFIVDGPDDEVMFASRGTTHRSGPTPTTPGQGPANLLPAPTQQLPVITSSRATPIMSLGSQDALSASFMSAAPSALLPLRPSSAIGDPAMPVTSSVERSVADGGGGGSGLRFNEELFQCHVELFKLRLLKELHVPVPAEVMMQQKQLVSIIEHKIAWSQSSRAPTDPPVGAASAANVEAAGMLKRALEEIQLWLATVQHPTERLQTYHAALTQSLLGHTQDRQVLAAAREAVSDLERRLEESERQRLAQKAHHVEQFQLYLSEQVVLRERLRQYESDPPQLLGDGRASVPTNGHRDTAIATGGNSRGGQRPNQSPSEADVSERQRLEMMLNKAQEELACAYRTIAERTTTIRVLRAEYEDRCKEVAALRASFQEFENNVAASDADIQERYHEFEERMRQLLMERNDLDQKVKALTAEVEQKSMLLNHQKTAAASAAAEAASIIAAQQAAAEVKAASPDPSSSGWDDDRMGMGKEGLAAQVMLLQQEITALQGQLSESKDRYTRESATWRKTQLTLEYDHAKALGELRQTYEGELDILRKRLKEVEDGRAAVAMKAMGSSMALGSTINSPEALDATGKPRRLSATMLNLPSPNANGDVIAELMRRQKNLQEDYDRSTEQLGQARRDLETANKVAKDRYMELDQQHDRMAAMEAESARLRQQVKDLESQAAKDRAAAAMALKQPKVASPTVVSMPMKASPGVLVGTTKPTTPLRASSASSLRKGSATPSGPMPVDPTDRLAAVLQQFEEKTRSAVVVGGGGLDLSDIAAVNASTGSSQAADGTSQLRRAGSSVLGLSDFPGLQHAPEWLEAVRHSVMLTANLQHLCKLKEQMAMRAALEGPSEERQKDELHDLFVVLTALNHHCKDLDRVVSNSRDSILLNRKEAVARVLGAVDNIRVTHPKEALRLRRLNQAATQHFAVGDGIRASVQRPTSALSTVSPTLNLGSSSPPRILGTTF